MFVKRFVPMVLLAGLFSVVSYSTPARGETLLRWKFKAGEKFRLTMTQDMQMKMVMKGTTNLVNAVSTMDMVWEVTAVDDSGMASLSQTIERVRMKMHGPQGVMAEYDSQSDEQPQGLATMFATLFDAMVGKPYTMKIGPRGNVEELTLPQGMAESMKKLPNGAQLGNLLSEQGLKDMAEITVFPEEPVSPGDTWTSEAAMKNPAVGNANITTTMQYMGPETRDGRQLERIDLKMDFQFGQGEKGMIKVTDQDGGGSIYFDNALGQLVVSESNMTMKTHISTMGQEIDQEVQVISKAECTRLDEAIKKDE